MSKIKTKVVLGWNGNYQVEFSIDQQTFKLEEVEGEEGWTSKDRAKWYEKQLNTAFNRLLEKESTELLKENNDIVGEMWLTECCNIGPIINEKYCPGCGKKITKQ